LFIKTLSRSHGDYPVSQTVLPDEYCPEAVPHWLFLVACSGDIVRCPHSDRQISPSVTDHPSTMKLVCAATLVLLFVAGARAAAGDLDAACKTTSPACTDPNASCQSDLCKCNPNFVKKNSACVPVVGKPCGRGQCLTYGTCTSDACACDTSMGFSTGVSGASTCWKKLGQTCSDASECVTGSGIICSTTCTCDTSKGFASAVSGGTSCSCDTSKATSATPSNDGKCVLKVDQPCTAASDCVSADGIVCADRNGATKCTCDTTKNYAAGANGAVTCACDTNYAIKADKSCGKKIDQACNAGTECIDGAKCDNSKCVCDTNANFAAGTAGADTCSCATNYAIKSDGTCGKKIDQACNADSECIDNAKCSSSKCACDTSKNFAAGTAGDDSCSLKVGQVCTQTSDCISTTGMICGDRSGATKCTCDTTKNFAAGSDGAMTCACDTTKAAGTPNNDGYCPLKVGQVCTAATQCISTDGMTCADRSGTVKCTCDTTKNYAAGSDGATSSCATNYAKRSSDKVCGEFDAYGLVIGQTCATDGTTKCIDAAVCDPVTLKCACDTGNGYAAGTTGATSCSCASTHVSTAWGCGKKVGATCSDTCSSMASCNATVGLCACDSGAIFQADTSTCKSGASTLVSSLAVLTAGILLALRKM
ncbi:hypothetical protein BaRGS_00017971, partial [Batillaria attramentaria]